MSEKSHPNPAPPLGRWSRRTLAFLCLASATAAGLAIALDYGMARARLKHWATQVEHGPPTDTTFQLYIAPGLDRPATRKAEHARLSDDETILGVTVKGRARAYRLKAMWDRSNHIINDIIEGEPISVTYCSLNDCVRGFTGPTRDVPLRISQGGLYKGKMMIRVGESEYLQESGLTVRPDRPVPSFPYAPFFVERMTWKEWHTSTLRRTCMRENRTPEMANLAALPEVTKAD